MPNSNGAPRRRPGQLGQAHRERLGETPNNSALDHPLSGQKNVISGTPAATTRIDKGRPSRA
jgi:hypothetical protein